MKIKFNYNKETGIAVATAAYDGQEFTAGAWCHPEDNVFMSEITGCHIAEARLRIKILQHIRKNKIKPALKEVDYLYEHMRHSRYFKEDNFEAKRLWKRRVELAEEFKNITDEITDRKASLHLYIEEKEKAHQKWADKMKKSE